uniref:Uncharacterized protein n=1 Tax=Salix viminalis TaxID=40686 RepID=A0A6N2LB10_SALVM
MEKFPQNPFFIQFSKNTVFPLVEREREREIIYLFSVSNGQSLPENTYPVQNHCPCLAYVAITLISMDSQIFNDFHEHRHLRFDLIYHKFHSIFFSDSKVGIVQE